MKGLLKGILVLAILGGTGYAVYHFVFANKTERACKRVAKLCGSDSPSQAALNKCESFFVKLEKASGKENITRAEQCIAKSETCASAMGCVVGAGLGAAGEFLKGIQKAIKK